MDLSLLYLSQRDTFDNQLKKSKLKNQYRALKVDLDSSQADLREERKKNIELTGQIVKLEKIVNNYKKRFDEDDSGDEGSEY